MNKKFLTIAIIVFVTGLLAFRLINNKKKIESKKQVKNTGEVAVAVNVALAEMKSSETNLTLVGTVIPNQEIEVKSEVQGKITNLYFNLGDYVAKGKALARIDDKIRSLSRANEEQKLADARQNLERYKNLFKGGAATQAQLDQHELAFKNAEIQLEQAGKELSNTTIVAPISGYITTKSIEAGAFANIGTPVATIVDVSSLKVQLTVPERDAYILKKGEKVKITSTVYPGVEFEGLITFISFKGDAAHNYPVEIKIKNNPDRPLKAGTYVDIAFNQKKDSKSLRIPREAMVGSVRDAKVYLVDGNNVAHLTPIKVAGDDHNFVEVADGLKPGDRVVISGQINLNDGSQVSIIH